MFKVIIAGGRDFTDYNLLVSSMDFYLSDVKEEIEVVCGEARGADSLGKRYALEKGYSVKSFPANWNKYGKPAGFIRNKEMAEYADAVVCFWDGVSRGTANMVNLAKEYSLPLRIKRY